MKEKKVTGVLNRDSLIRDEHLKRNYGKYSQYTEDLTPAIGEVYNIDYQRPLYDITGGKSLFDYTHNINEEYGQNINRKYFNGREKDIIGYENLTPDQIQSWGGKYLDYTAYLDEVLGEDVYSRHVTYINDLLSGQFIENALRQTEVGVVRNINVPIAKQGIITTNTNNLKGIDTPLGTITNYMYSTILYNGAIFNSDRKSETKYITPSLINQYGNNLSNVMELGDILRVGVGDYRLRDDLGANANIIHDFKDTVGDLNIKYLTQLTDEASRYLAENNEGFKGYKLGEDGYIKYIGGKEELLDLTDFAASNFKSEYNQNYIKTYDIYNENDIEDGGFGNAPDNEDDVAWEHYESLDDSFNKSILSKTAKLFNEHKINTLIGRFHTSTDGGIMTEQEFIDTAKSKYGNSHGRNLLTREAQDSNTSDADDTNGYDNPYCRTWTFHHQYNQVKKLIRPFIEKGEDGVDTAMDIASIQNRSGKFRTKDSKGRLIGPNYLANNTVLNKNGFVNISPSEDNGVKKGVPIEKCMFSIENLAWKDVQPKEKYISKEQTGPNGGRIMWFPPYDLSFAENINVAWNESTFIGRGEKVYTYTNTDRTGTLSFTLLIDHPSIVNSFAKLENGDISSDIDSDILRYFAGCDIPEVNVKEDKEIPGDIPGQGERISEIEGSFSFYVYFPNNFSGMVTSKKADENTVNEYYDGWWEYILAGNNCELFSDKENWNGYEVTDNIGLSSILPDEESKKYWIGVSTCWWNKPGDGCIGDTSDYDINDAENVNKETGAWCYKYKVDKDLRQKLGSYLSNPNPLNENFEDKKSSQLNTYLRKEELQKDADFTFGEVIIALLKNGNIKPSTLDKDQLVEFLTTNGCNSEYVDNLVKIFSADGLKITSITIDGSADQNDKNNADMLAKRRALSIKTLLSTSNLPLSDTQFTCDGKKSNELPEGLTDNLKNKLQRYSFVTVNYKLPGTKELLSYANRPQEGSLAEKEAEEEKNFSEWYDELMGRSDIIVAYNDTFENEQFEKQGNTFDAEIKEWCDQNKISYILADYTEDSQWTDVINKLIGTDEEPNYGFKYFMPAVTISDTETNSDFIGELAKHPPVKMSKEAADKVAVYQQNIDDNLISISELSGECSELESKIIELGGSDCLYCSDPESQCLGGKNQEYINNIHESEDLIAVYQSGSTQESGITQYEERIEEIDYQLEHWTVQYGEKSALTREKKACQNKISALERKIAKEEEKIVKNQDNIDENLDEISQKQGELDDNKYQISNLQKENNQYNTEISKLSGTTGSEYLNLDLIITQVYFEKMYEATNSDGNSLFNIDYYNDSSINYPFDFTIQKTWDDDFPYKKYITESITTGNVSMDYGLLLHDYLVISQLSDNIKDGLEFGCEYLFNNDADFNQLKELVYLQYLLEGNKDKDWVDLVENNPQEITYKTAWLFIDSYYYNQSGRAITYQPFIDAVVDAHNGIQYFNEGTIGKDMLLNQYIIPHTAEVLKYCETTIEDIMSCVQEEANNGYNSAKKAAEDAAKEKEAQKMHRTYQAECDTLNNLKKELQDKKDQFMLSIFVGNTGITRYETEAEFFQKLDIEHPLIFKSIKEKYKYFNPAFHSMSPEGFNARLNFLHQCTRQGHTYEAGNGVTTAHNLAFGRMPVCVLRIGDFINTRIIINNVNINYDNGGIQWDLNPEGIGVQPMFAKVNLGITIIGGQSLNGPINRLQNAVSFNYYANTGVYDDRADRYKIDKNGKIIGFEKIFTIGGEDKIDKTTSYRSENQNNEDAVKSAQDKKKEFEDARNAYEDRQLSDGNDVCQK